MGEVRKVVIAHPDRKAQRTLQRLVGATRCKIEVVADAAALASVVGAKSVVVIDCALAIKHPELRALPALGWIAVPGEGNAPAEAEGIMKLLAEGWPHIIAHPMPILAEELLATVQKILRREVFGLEKYIAWGAEVRSFMLEDARDRDAAVAEIAKDIVALGLPDRMGSLVSVVADELIANALYVAPVDEHGVRFRANEPREASRVLDGRDAVTVCWATDGRYVGIQVRDQWGSIEPAVIGTRLATPTQSGQESGMGLQLAYACSNQFIIGHAPGYITEVIALLDIRFKPTELGKKASFHVFVGAPPP